MESNKKNGIANLSKKATAVFGAALAALTGVQANAALPLQNDNLENNTTQVMKIRKVKPMPVLKMNLFNPENSQFVASHTSHASHRSHSSHYSHRSGAMFS